MIHGEQLFKQSPEKGDLFLHEDTLVRIQSREISSFYVCTIVKTGSLELYVGQRIELHKDTFVIKV